MKKITGSLAVFLVAASLAGCGIQGNGQQTAEGSTKHVSSEVQKQNTSGNRKRKSDTGTLTAGTKRQRGFINDNVLHSGKYGDIHFSSYIPKSYDGSRAYALFVTLPGYDGLYFQGVGENMKEDFGPQAIRYNKNMIILSPQLNDWEETSANQTIALTEYFLRHYKIDRNRVYLHGYSGGGETGSLVMGKRPDLYTAFLACSTKWDGSISKLVKSRTPVYLAVGEDDSYYGSEPLKDAYRKIYRRYQKKGLSRQEIRRLLILDVKNGDYFTSRGYSDQHAGGQAFAKDRKVMGWLFGKH